MAHLRHSPPLSFTDRVDQEDLELRGIRARAMQFPEGTRDPSRALVCIAGMGANGRSFVRQRPLAQDWFTLLLNTPTESPATAQPLEFLCDVVEEFLHFEGLSNPVLLGSSFGGTIAATLALRGRIPLRALILVSPVLSRWQIPLANRTFVDLLEAPQPLASLFAPMAAQIMGGFALDRDSRDEIVRESRHFSGTELKRRLQVLLELDLFPKLATLRIPTLFVHGTRDLLVPWRRGRAAAQQVPGARFLAIKGAGHLPYLSHPAPFNGVVSEFLHQAWVAAATGPRAGGADMTFP
jgi:pimeloyl-ACP methyl ester carboxylesterase